ncbi:miniconductance mechanosensitive channel MscM [Candidatus Erwinia haradaeae]|uniref:Miniconductance mechanosensitive channel MscM n=1 Tax=Candidatus Erwinia haradaeae TaxID=1922217 RepID=A0A451D2L5_9GAMM|nr:miniconductance mechanosensitive channel MscM [Candidatus Erwinia haradaeae]VFP79900.1 Miniconductance mechanosensitive channel MscM [Candidatus Erwinia haradaeae]
MFYFIFAISLGWTFSQSVYGANLEDILKIRKEYQEAKSTINNTTNHIINHNVQSTSLNWIEEYQKSVDRAQEYRKFINNFPKQSHILHQQIAKQMLSKNAIYNHSSITSLEKKIFYISNQIIEESWKAQAEHDRAQKISRSFSHLSQNQLEARRAFDQIRKKLQIQPSATNTNEKLQQIQQKEEFNARKARIDELDLEQLSANNRQELARMNSEMHQQKAAVLSRILQKLRNELHNQRQHEGEKSLAANEEFAEGREGIPYSISEQFHINRTLSAELKQQAIRMDRVAAQQRIAAEQTIQIRQALSTICEQSQWLGASNVLAEALRGLVARLPKIPKPQQLDREMAELRAKRLYYSDLFEHKLLLKQDKSSPLTIEQERILVVQLKTQNALLVSLLSGSDILTLELTKLNVANSQLVDALNEVKDATHRYLFWTPDINAINFSYPGALLNDLREFFSLNTLSQLGKAVLIMLTSYTTLLPFFLSSLLVFFSFSSRRHIFDFLTRASSKVGKVTQDQFNLTVRTLLLSVLVSLPLPVLLAALGYGLQNAWPYPLAVAIGDGVISSIPILLGLMICNSLSCEQGLFIVHFRWPKNQVVLVTRCCKLCIWVIIPLIMISVSVENFSDHKFSPTLGRMCFILICGLLGMMTATLKHSGIPLYFHNRGNIAYVMNNIFWNIMIVIPIVAILATCIGYLETAQALLARLETSLVIGLVLLIIYHIIRRWMLIQRRRIAFDRARIRRAEILSHRTRTEEKLSIQRGVIDHVDLEEAGINLESISTQSLKLVKSLLMLIGLVCIIALWSEIHAAFSFLENIHLWDVSSMIHGIDTVQPITLGSLVNAIVVFIITTQLVRNMPALLELVLLQHLNLMPGTGYAITTSSKYLIVLLGSLTCFSLIGIDWSKLQWLVAGLSLGLGFGLQEIFANFISGLIILFEKPIRIGDTVTIRNLTGNVTRINTRATTITDWDRKEIIVPNRSFITEQFTNWSLSDSITRVVLSISTSLTANTEVVTNVLLEAADRCRFVLKNPIPEAFLVDLQQGLQLFELRIHAAEMEHRMPLRHDLHRLILLGFQEHSIDIQLPISQVRIEVLRSQVNIKH